MRRYVDIVRGLKANTGGMYGPRSTKNKKTGHWSTLESINTAIVVTSREKKPTFISLKEVKRFGFVKKQDLRKSQMNYFWKKKNPIIFFSKDRIKKVSKYESGWKFVFMKKKK